tara:strand:+ start:1036 stop:1659 length:624 start_codon:yes stop_codon:yes gene_type:complete
MKFNKPTFGWQTPEFMLPTVQELSTGFCGIHRGSVHDVEKHMPYMMHVLKDSPAWEDITTYEIDIKVHMLMRGQYPCIPNWHCDNVPRIDTGELVYDQIPVDARPMLLWVSGNPTTEFLTQDVDLPDIQDHGELAALIRDRDLPTQKIPKRTWVYMNQRTPHRGTQATKPSWRIFIRLTPKEIAPQRQVLSVIRRHTQVYLPADFHW